MTRNCPNCSGASERPTTVVPCHRDQADGTTSNGDRLINAAQRVGRRSGCGRDILKSFETVFDQKRIARPPLGSILPGSSIQYIRPKKQMQAAGPIFSSFQNRNALSPMNSADALRLQRVLVLLPAFVRALQCFRVRCFEPVLSLRLRAPFTDLWKPSIEH